MKIHIDTTDAHKALDEIEERLRRRAKDAASDNPAAVAQALKRYNRRNGIEP